MILARATWTEVEAFDREGVVVLPIGGVEPNGRSVPMGAATILAETVALRMESRRPEDVLLAPTLPIGTAGASGNVAGTIDLGYDVFSATVRAVVASLSRHGWRKVLLLAVGPSREVFLALNVVARALKNADPRLQIAKFDDGVENYDRYLAALTALDPSLVRVVDGEPVRLDLDVPAISEAETPNARQDRAWRHEHRFVTDWGEGDSTEWGVTTEPMDQEWGEQVLEEIVADAVDLVDVMRRGRVYVQWDDGVEEDAPDGESPSGEE